MNYSEVIRAKSLVRILRLTIVEDHPQESLILTMIVVVQDQIIVSFE